MVKKDQLDDKAIFMTLLKQASHRGLSNKAMAIMSVIKTNGPVERVS